MERWRASEPPPSAVAPASGWWLASDGIWYPPELHPDAHSSDDFVANFDVVSNTPQLRLVDAGDLDDQTERAFEPADQLRATDHLLSRSGRLIETSRRLEKARQQTRKRRFLR